MRYGSVASAVLAIRDRFPEIIAIEEGAKAYTYRELISAVGFVHSVVEQRERVGPVVPIHLERGVEAIAAMLGVVSAGAAFLMLDTRSPPSRTRRLLETVGAAWVLGEPVPGFDSMPVADMESMVRIGAGQPALHIATVSASDPAFVIGTSGSTGAPKAVLVQHGLLNNMLAWQQSTALEVAPETRVLQLAPLAFDVSVQEVFTPLCQGGKLVLCPDALRSQPTELLELIREAGIQFLYLPAVALHQLAEAGLRADPTESLQHVVCAGETLRVTDAVRRWFSSLNGCQLHNHYGLSETHVLTAHTLSGDPSSWPSHPPIGHAITGAEVQLETVPGVLAQVGEVGELVAHGEAVCLGYLGASPEENARFFMDPRERRALRTGDLGYVGDDGELHFVGRADRQVKIRGYRVELKEVETLLLRHPNVSWCSVVPRPDVAGQTGLVAVLLTEPPALELEALRRDPRFYSYLSEHLPEYMVPETYFSIGELPRTDTGKVDLAALLRVPIARPAMPVAFSPPRTDLEKRIAEIWCEALSLVSVGRDDPFFELGGNSLLAAWVVQQLEGLGHGVKIADFLGHPTVASLAGYLESPSDVEVASAKPRFRACKGHEEIAIVGMAGRFPGAPDVRTYWQNLKGGVDAVERGTRAPVSSGETVFASATLSDIDRFDASLFGLSRREAELLDPQHRILLECSWLAVEDAGIPPTSVAGERIGVWMGAGTPTYLINNVNHAERVGSGQNYLGSVSGLQLMLGSDGDYLATRISHRMDLRGPSVNLQAACATGLFAVHYACQSIRAGECDAALVGAANVMVPQVRNYVYEDGMPFSPDGLCRAFDERASGMMFGSGAGVVFLKPLSAALRAGDPVYALVRGSAARNDGRNRLGFMAPSIEGQEWVLREALASGGVDPESIGFVEAHGTGTALGDMVEVSALRRVYGHLEQGTCALGSVKTGIGHLAWASGVAGLIKATMAVREGVVPATLHHRRANPELGLEHTPFFVNGELVDWPRCGPRIAGVSSFGLGGSSAHVLVEGVSQAPVGCPSSRSAHVFRLSARSPEGLKTLANRLSEFVRSTQPRLGDLALTLNVGRSHHKDHRAVVASSPEELLSELEGIKVQGRSGEPGGVAFLFTGMGSNWVGMGRDLYAGSALVRSILDRCDLACRPLGVDLLQGMWEGTDLNCLRIGQPATFALGCALFELFKSWGVAPDLLLGHSLGEYVAAYAAGVIGLEDGVRLVSNRGALMDRLESDGAMLSVAASPSALEDVVARPGITLAVDNGPQNVVLAGARPRLLLVRNELESRGLRCFLLKVEAAGHSPLMDPVLPELTNALEQLSLRPPQVPILSNVTGDRVGAEMADVSYWLGHTTGRVRFRESVLRAKTLGARILIELGPKPTLVPLGMQCLPEDDLLWLSSLEPEVSCWRTLSATVADLSNAGVYIDWTRFTDPAASRVHAPATPLERESFWVGPPDGSTTTSLELIWRASPPPSSTRGAKWIVVHPLSLTTLVNPVLKAVGRVERVVSYTLPEDLSSFGVVLGETKGRVGVLVFSPIHAEGAGDPKAVSDDCDAFLRVAQATLQEAGERASLNLVTWGAQGVREVARPGAAAVWGLARVVALEHPRIRCRRIDCESTLDGPSCDLLAEILQADDAEDTVAVRSGRRMVGRISEREVIASTSAPLDSEASYVVTGGFGNLGPLVAGWLVERGARRVALIGRRDPGSALMQAPELVAASAAGASITCHVADVTDGTQLDRVLTEIAKEGRIAGVIHAAGRIDDGVVLQLDRARLDAVMAPKVTGALNLHRSLAKHGDQEFLVFFSSVSSLLGNLGQANYAAGNAFLDSFAAWRNASGARTLSLNWGHWGSAGALKQAKEIAQSLETMGYIPLSVSDAFAALDHLLESGRPRGGVCPARWESLIPALGVTELASSWELWRPSEGEAGATDPREVLQEELRRILGDQPFDPDATFMGLGLDSLGSIRLCNALRRRAGIRLPINFSAVYPTLAQLASHVEEQLATRNAEEGLPGDSPADSDDGKWPLSMQQRRWIQLIRKGYGRRFVPVIFKAPLDPLALRRALVAVVERHEILRATYEKEGEVLLLSAEDVVPAEEQLVQDVSCLPLAARQVALAAHCERILQSLPDPSQGPTWRVSAARLGDDSFAVILGVQHIDFEGTSLTVFVDELEVLYMAQLRGETLRLPPVEQYRTYAIEQLQQPAEEKLADSAFFQEMFSSMQEIPCLPRHPGFAYTRPLGSRRFSPPRVEGLWKHVQTVSATLGVTPFAFVLTNYAILLSEILRTPDLVVGVISSGRVDGRFLDTVGPFTMPVPLRLNGGAISRELLLRNQSLISEVQLRTRTPVSRLLRDVSLFSGFPEDSYFADVSINFGNYGNAVAKEGGCRTEILEVLGRIEEPNFARVNTEQLVRIPGLHLVVSIQEGEVLLNFWYHEERVYEEDVASWSRRLIELFWEHPDR